MSEYQYVSFRAVDKPVKGKDLEYMRKQSTRAEVTPWSFSNEYHYGDFHGNTLEMMRRGYDLHLHYANFGTRTLMIRLPEGFPDAKAAQEYLGEEGLRYIEDKTGPGGILCVEPYYEVDSIEELWDTDFEELIEELMPLRDELMSGDLRSLYLLHLVVCRDSNHDPEETQEGPVPAGLGRLGNHHVALAEYYDLRDELLEVAVVGAPAQAAARKTDPQVEQMHWLEAQPSAVKDKWLADLMSDSDTAVRAELLREFKKTRPVVATQSVRLNRTMSALNAASEDRAKLNNKKAAESEARARTKRLANMAADPEKVLKKTEQLISKRNSEAYAEVAELLADLRDSLAGTDQAHLAEQQVQRLRSDNPNLRGFISELRRHGLAKK